MEIDKKKYIHSEKREKGRQQYRVSEGEKGTERERVGIEGKEGKMIQKEEDWATVTLHWSLSAR